MTIKSVTRLLPFLSLLVCAKTCPVPNRDWIQKYESYFSRDYSQDVVRSLVSLFNHMQKFMEDPNYTWPAFCKRLRDIGFEIRSYTGVSNKISSLADALMACEDGKCIAKTLWDAIGGYHRHPDELLKLGIRSEVLKEFVEIAEQRIFASLSPERQEEILQQRKQEQEAQRERRKQEEQEAANNLFIFKGIVTGTVLGMSYSMYKCCCR